MKIINSAQSKALDKATIRREPISSIDLMERAGKKIATKLFSKYGNNRPYIILCGNGNNGGDDFWMAKSLPSKGYNIEDVL